MIGNFAKNTVRVFVTGLGISDAGSDGGVNGLDRAVGFGEIFSHDHIKIGLTGSGGDLVNLEHSKLLSKWRGRLATRPKPYNYPPP